MKLAIVSACGPRFLSLGSYLRPLLPALASSPSIDEIVVLADRDSELDPELRDVRVEPAWDADSPFASSQILWALVRERPDLVWFNSQLMLGNSAVVNMLRLVAPRLARRLGFPVAVTLHHLIEATSVDQLGASTSRLHRWAGRLATQFQCEANALCVTLDRYVELVNQHYSAEHVVHIPHHVFAPPRAHPVRKRAANVLCLGLQAPFKGVNVLVQASRIAARTFPELRLTVAGAVHPRFRDSEALTVNSGPLRCLGHVDELAMNDILADTDVVVVPSLATTGSSSVIHRAMAHGKAVIASDLPDFRALVREESAAIEFCPPGDADSLARAMVRVCRDHALRLRARDLNLAAASKLTPTHVAGRYLALFHALAQPAPRPLPLHLAAAGSDPIRLIA